MLVAAFVLFLGFAGQTDACDLGSYEWQPWDPCSKPCAGGTRSRHGDSCFWGIDKTDTGPCNEFCRYDHSYYSGICHCPSWRHGTCCEHCSYIDIEHCKSGQQECGGSPDNIRCTECEAGYHSAGYGKGCVDIDECASSPCKNGATCMNELNEYRCICAVGWGGTNCDEALCGWREKWCWPGQCGTSDYERNCHCDSGFQIERFGSSTMCQLTENPKLKTCRVGLEDVNRDAVNTTGTGKCSEEQSVYTNLQPHRLSFTLDSSFSINVTSNPADNRIESWMFGIVDNSVKMVEMDVRNNEHIIETQVYHTSPECNNAVSDRQPKQLVSCSGTLSPRQVLQNGESVCANFAAFAGGVLTSKDKTTSTYKRTETTRKLCFMFDDHKPDHCTGTTTCLNSMLHVNQRITESPDIKVTFSSWTDPVPNGGIRSQASGIKQFVASILRVENLDKTTMVMKFPGKPSITVAAERSYVNFTLPDEPALYAVLLEVNDIAGNVRMARRFVLYDNSSKVAVFPTKYLRSETASSKTNYTWQIHHGKTCLNWTGRYYNTYHLTTNLLKSIKRDGNISISYDQNDGLIPVSGTPNIHGIVRFNYTWKLGNSSFKPFSTASDLFSQSFCEELHPSDGHTYTFTVKPVDINSRSLTEYLVVHIDRSPPSIDNIWLVKNGNKQLFVHDSSDLSKMALQFDALDIHSGLETVQWRLGTTDGEDDIGSGSVGVQRINGSCDRDSCYCPMINLGNCEYYVYTVNLNELVANRTNEGQHNRIYFFTVIVTNNAKLVNIEHLDILADDSPPVEGMIQEGDTDSPDIDYTNDNKMLVNWHGFIDHESGIKFYRVGLSDSCLSKEELGRDNSTDNNTNIIETSKTIESFPLQVDGYYITSIIAYNNAMEPSEVICSDGFQKDSTSPFILNVTLKHSKVMEVIACDASGPWLVRSDLTKVAIASTQICIERCAITPPVIYLESLLEVKMNYNDTDIADELCLRLPYVTDNWYIYIPSNNIDISWLSTDAESQIRSEEVGFASDPSATSSPDIEAYKDTHGYSRYHNTHAGINTGVPFYITIRATNKAEMESIVALGPIIIDDTPPEYTKGLKVRVDQSDDKIYCYWKNDTFIDTQQRHAVDYILYRIGSDERFYTPMLQIPPGQRCIREDLNACVHYPIHKLQRQDEEKGLQFFFELYVYNMAEHFTTVRSNTFTLPSQYLPGHGHVFDIDPSVAHRLELIQETPDLALDVDVHFTTEQVCAYWSGFYHHQNVTFQIGVGTEKTKDNSSPFQVVQDKTQIVCLNASKFIPFVNYFVSIKATCSAGSVIVSSDGITIVDKSQIDYLFNVTVGTSCDGTRRYILNRKLNDNGTLVHFTSVTPLIIGHGYTLEAESDFNLKTVMSDDVLWLENTHCNGKKLQMRFRSSENNPLFSIQINNGSNIHTLNMTIFDCNENIKTTDSSQSLSVFWNIQKNIKELVTTFEGTVFIDKCAIETEAKTTCLSQVIGTHNISRGRSFTFNNLPLNNRQAYRVGIRVCFQQLCMPYTFSDKVFVQYLPPTTNRIESFLKISNKPCIDVTIDLEKFDCIQKSVQSENLKWSLASSEKADGLLSSWIPVIISNHSERNVTIQGCVKVPVYLHRPMFACVKTMCESGAISSTCTSLHTPHPNDYLVRHLYEIDANDPSIHILKNNLHAQFLGDTLILLQKLDLDYCTKNTTLFGAISNSAERNITWFLLTNNKIPSLTCEESQNCVKSLETTGGYAIMHKANLIPGTLYYICARSNRTTIHRELFDEDFEEIEICGNGFLVDDTPPSPGRVSITNQRNGFLLDQGEIIISWTGFEDRLSRLPSNFSSTIQSYSYAIGTSPGGLDVSPFKCVGQSDFVHVNSLHLQNGKTYYVTVKATDHVGLSVEDVSPAVTMDSTPPIGGTLTVGGALIHRYLMATKHLNVYWNGFEDPESGIDNFHIGIGTQPGLDNIIPYKEILEQYVDLSRETCQDGLAYLAMLKVTNKAGLTTTVSSDPFILDSSPPARGVVRDGANFQSTDIDYQNFTSSLTCHWEAFSDPHSGIQFYRVGLGTAPNKFDTNMLTEVGLRTEITWTDHLVAGERYFTTVEACNGAGLCTRHHSDGVILDNSPPIPGLIHVGVSNRHQTYQSHRNAISAQWFGFEDPHSDLDHFEWCVSVNANTCDILPFANILLSKSVFKSLLNLPLKTAIFVKLKAYNNVGMYTETISDSFKVDDTHPELVKNPEFVLKDMQVSHQTKTQWDNSLLRLTWKFMDPDSPITRHVVRLHTHHDGKVRREVSLLGNEDTVTIRMDEKDLLKNGDRYWATVTACNAAGLCSNATSDDLLIDSSPPQLGGFKPPMTWNNIGNTSEVSLTWYGFSDVESGINTYFITISRYYSGSEVSAGITIVDAEGESDQNCSIKIKQVISEDDTFILSIWAINAVGLRSDIGKVTVTVLTTDSTRSRGVLKLQKHSCTTHYCNNDCTCAVVGEKCKRKAALVMCLDVSNGTDYQSVRVFGGMLKDHQALTASSSCLSAHWISEQDNAVNKIQRYEWSIGITKPGDGYFKGPFEAVWHDVGLQTNVTSCISKLRQLIHNTNYTVFVKSWYSEQMSKVFSSPPITVDITPPDIVQGAHVYVSTDECVSDVHFITNSSLMHVCWRNVFRERTSDILKYELTAGTSVYGDDLVTITDYGKATNATLNNLPVYPGTKYYFTVRVTNTVDLMTSLASVAIVLDDLAPYTGIVFNTDLHHNVRFQSSMSTIGLSWHGFGDHYSHIHHYSAWVTEVATGRVVYKKSNVGIKTSVVFSDVKLTQEHMYIGSVQAWDAAGYVSSNADSESFTVDETPPGSFRCTNFSNVNFNEYFNIGSKEISFSANLTKDTFYKMNLTVNNTMHSAVIQLSFGHHLMILQMAQNADRTKEAVYSFLSPYEATIPFTISLPTSKDNNSVLISLMECNEMEFETSKIAIDVMQISPFQLSMCSRILDQESGIRSIQIGVGTTKGGFQVCPLSTVPLENHIVIEHSSLHGTTLYVTAIAHNHAGLWSMFEGNEVVVDHTPPDILNISTTIRLKEIANQTEWRTATMAVSGFVQDTESGIKSCSCFIDMHEEIGLIHSTDTSSTVICLFNGIVVEHGTTLIPRIQCINNIELLSLKRGDPLVPSFLQPSRSNALIEISPWNEISCKETGYIIQANLTTVQAQWSGFHDVSGIEHYMYKLMHDNTTVAMQTDVGLKTMMTMTGLSLKDGEVYTISVEAVNIGGVHSDPVLTSLTVDSRKPGISGYPVKVLQSKDGSTEIDWADAFTIEGGMTLIFDINIGTREGYSDVIDRLETMTTSIVLSRTNNLSVWVAVRARYVTGRSSDYRGTIVL